LREILAQRCHDHSVAWFPAHPIGLPLEDLDLATACQHVGLESGPIAVASCERIEQEPKQRRNDRNRHHAAGAKS
jgi:hypothetical protein